MARVVTKTGLKANLPNSSMLKGELHATTDRGTLHLPTDATTRIPVVPPIDDLVTLASISGADDLILIHDASATGQKEKKMTFNDFKSALNVTICVDVIDGGTF